MQTITESFTLGEAKRFYVPGRFFRLMESTATVTLLFYRNGSLVGSAFDVGAGFAWEGANKTDELFDSISVTSSAAQSIKFAASNEPVSYDRSAGSVDINSIANRGAVTQTALILSSEVQLLPANDARRFLMLQNVGTLVITYTVNGASANGSTAFPLVAGASILFDVFVPNGEVRVFSSGSFIRCMEG